MVNATAATPPITNHRTIFLIVRAYTERVSAWINYSLVRLGLFGASFALLVILGVWWWVSALIATVVAFTLSYIFFHRQRTELAKDLQKRVEKSASVDPDAQSEDDATSQGDSKA